MNKRNQCLMLAISAVLMTSAAPVTAQMGASAPLSTQSISAPAIRGQVSDASGRLVLGAIVRLEGVNREAATDNQGRFRFENLPAGTYEMTVDYLGAERQSHQVTVTSSSGAEVAIALASVGHTGQVEELTVYGARGAQERALNAQRAADSIKSVVSADYLGNFPDANVAESMQRLAGAAIQRDQGEGRYVNLRGAPVEFSNVTLNGVNIPATEGTTRAVDLDTIPSDVIAMLEVSKAITPNLDADAIAGNINIVTQGALDSQGRILRANLSQGHNELGSGNLNRWGITYGDRITDNLAILVSANHRSTDRVTNNIEHSWAEFAPNVYVPELTEFKDYELNRSRQGFSGRLDYLLGDNAHFYLSHNYSQYKDVEFRDSYIIEWDQVQAGSDGSSGQMRGTFEKEIRDRSITKTIRTSTFGGEHMLDSMTIDYNLSISKSTDIYPTRDQFVYRQSVRPQVRYDFTNPNLPTYEVLDGGGNVVRTDFDFATPFNFREYQRRFQGAEEKENSGAINFTLADSTWLDASSSIKFGLKARMAEKEFGSDRFRSRTGAPVTPAFVDVTIGRQSEPFDGYYNNGPKLIRNFVELYGPAIEGDAGYAIRVAQSIVADYQAEEDTLAAYVMNTLTWDRTTMVYGLRAERIKTSGQAFQFDEDTEVATVLTDSNRYTKLFPSLHLRYVMDNEVILRAAYSTGMSRPNYADLAPYAIFNDSDEVSLGNPDLDPTYAHNFDLMAEYYTRPLGVISGGVFYKRLSNPIFTAQSTAVGGIWDGFEQTRAENGENGRLWGVELNVQRDLPFVEGLSASFNYTWADSSADLPFGLGKTALRGTSARTYNAALKYDRMGFSTQLAYNSRSEYIDAYTVDDPALNIYWDGRSTLDWTANYRVNDMFTVFGEVTNIQDTRQIRYQGDRTRVYEHESFGRTLEAGVRMSF